MALDAEEWPSPLRERVYGRGLVTLYTGVFGGLIVSLLAPAEFDVAKALPQLINEVLFPVGCSLALFAADAIGKRTGS